MKKIKILFGFFILAAAIMIFASCTNVCNHSWQPATCTSPKTCSLCQKTEGTINEHSWQLATCTSPKTCSLCKKTEGTVKGHDYKDGICSICQEIDPVKEQLEIGEMIFLGLTTINSTTTKQASTVHKAWHFAIYDASDYSPLWGGWTEAISDFASSIGFKKDVVVEAIDEYLRRNNDTPDETSRYMTVSTISGAVGVVSIIYEKINTPTKNLLDQVKEMIKEMEKEYEEETLYSILKEYYSETLSYYNFVSSPSGSFSQFSSTINGYNSRLNKHISDLSFVYGN